MKFNPHPYQHQGIDWIERHPYCALFWDMGLGKSVTVLTAFQRLQDCGEVRNMLVVAPLTVAEATWSGETAKWRHLGCLIVSRCLGSAAQRRRGLEADADVYVINHDNFAWLAKEYDYQLPFDMVVLDELTSFKNSGTQRFKAFKKCRPSLQRVVGLTGTPTSNGLQDLWAQMYCIDMGERLGRFKTRWEDENFHIFRVNGIPLSRKPRAGALERNTERIADICMTLKAADYLTLPPLQIHDIHIKLSDPTQKIYDEFEREQLMSFDSEGQSANVVADNAAALMSKLSQVASGAVYDEDGTTHRIHSEKLPYLADIVETAQQQGSGVLVFYNFRSEIPAICDCLAKYKPRLYDGEAALTAWNAGNVAVLLAHPASVSYGLNLQAGGCVCVWTTPIWSLERYLQANARLYRQGQQKPVHIYRLIASGTVDEKAIAALDDKNTSQEALISALKKLQRKYLRL